MRTTRLTDQMMPARSVNDHDRNEVQAGSIEFPLTYHAHWKLSSVRGKARAEPLMTRDVMAAFADDALKDSAPLTDGNDRSVHKPGRLEHD